ncbi:hypothetical protein AAMO2058_001381900 [Amorphochlora amoebiformis]
MELLIATLSANGPHVTAIVLKANGKTETPKLDMTPRLNTPAQVLGGGITFLGTMPDLDVVVMIRRDQEGLPENKHHLPKPYTTAQVFGDILLIRMDESATPQDISLAEYKAYVEKKESEADEPEDANEHAYDVDEEEDDEDEEEDSDEDEEPEEEKENKAPKTRGRKRTAVKLEAKGKSSKKKLKSSSSSTSSTLGSSRYPKRNRKTVLE